MVMFKKGEKMKKKLGKKDRNEWEVFKQSSMIDRSDKLLNDPDDTIVATTSAADLGNCQVKVSFMDNQLFFEIMPNETTNMKGDVEGIIVGVDEDKCHVFSVLKIVENALQVKDAKKNGKPIKQFTW